MTFCEEILASVLRCFAVVIRQLPPGMFKDVVIIILIVRVVALATWYRVQTFRFERAFCIG